MRTILQRVSFGRRGRVPKRNSTLPRLEELETRTVLSTGIAGLALPAAPGLANGTALPVLGLIPSTSAISQAPSSGQTNPSGAATPPGGTSLPPGTPTIPGSNLLTNPSNPPGSTSTTPPGQTSSQPTSSGSDMSSTAAQQNAAAASPFLLSPNQTTPTTTTNNNSNTTGSNSAQQGSAAPQSLLVIVLDQPLLVAGAEQRAETIPVITAAQSNPEGAVVSAQTLASARASTTPQLQILLGDVPLSNVDDDSVDRKDDGRGLDKPTVPDKAAPKQEKNEPKQAQPDDKAVPPVVPLEEAILSDKVVSTLASDACFAIWETEMAPADQPTQPPVPTSGEETPNWSVAALGLALGGVWGMRPARPREDRKRHPAWPARPTYPR